MAQKTIKNNPQHSRIRAQSDLTRSRSDSTSDVEEDFFAKAFRASPHPIGVTELETGCCLEINDACLEIFGFRRDEVIGKTTLLLGIWPDPQERARFIDRLKSEGSVRNLEVSMRMKNGELRRFLISTDLIELSGIRCLLTMGNDITERKRAEEALRRLNETLEQRVAERTAAVHEREERFRTFLNNAANLAFMKACDGRYLYVNRRFEEAFQLEQKEIVGKGDTDLFGREQADQYQANDRCVLETGKAMEFEEMSLYADGLHTNIVVKFPVRDGSGQVYAMGGIATDITDRKKVESELRLNQKALRSQQAQLQELAAKLLTAQEQERKRIARDLHDEFTQQLAALTIDLQSLSLEASESDALYSDRLKQLGDRAEQLTTDLQRLAHQLHSSLLDHVGLEAAAHEHVEEFAARTGLTAEMVVRNLPTPVPLEQATCLYRVLQESLQNVRKHAEATNVLVRLLGTGRGVGISVLDDGRGFEQLQHATGLKGLGLTSMEERVRALQGTFHVRTRDRDGTEVHAWVPLPDVTDAADS